MADTLNDNELRAFALSVKDAHDPAHQSHNYERCALCGFTRHPCYTFDLAESVVTLLDRLEAL